MDFIGVVKSKFRQADERSGAFLDRFSSPRIKSLAMIGAMLSVMLVSMMALFTGNVAAAGVTGTANIGYGISIMDAILLGVGIVVLIANLFLNHPVAWLIGGVMVAAGLLMYMMGY